MPPGKYGYYSKKSAPKKAAPKRSRRRGGSKATIKAKKAAPKVAYKPAPKPQGKKSQPKAAPKVNYKSKKTGPSGTTAPTKVVKKPAVVSAPKSQARRGTTPGVINRTIAPVKPQGIKGKPKPPKAVVVKAPSKPQGRRGGVAQAATTAPTVKTPVNDIVHQIGTAAGGGLNSLIGFGNSLQDRFDAQEDKQRQKQEAATVTSASVAAPGVDTTNDFNFAGTADQRSSLLGDYADPATVNTRDISQEEIDRGVTSTTADVKKIGFGQAASEASEATARNVIPGIAGLVDSVIGLVGGDTNLAGAATEAITKRFGEQEQTHYSEGGGTAGQLIGEAALGGVIGKGVAGVGQGIKGIKGRITSGRVGQDAVASAAEPEVIRTAAGNFTRPGGATSQTAGELGGEARSLITGNAGTVAGASGGTVSGVATQPKVPTGAFGRGSSAGRINKPPVPTGAFGRGSSAGRITKPAPTSSSLGNFRGRTGRGASAGRINKPKVPTGAFGRGSSAGRITKPVVKTPTGASGRGASAGRITKPLVAPKTPTGAFGRGASAGRIVKPLKVPTGAFGRGSSAGRITKPAPTSSSLGNFRGRTGRGASAGRINKPKVPAGAFGRGASTGRILKPKVPTGAFGRGASTGRILKPKTPTGAFGRGSSTGRILKPKTPTGAFGRGSSAGRITKPPKVPTGATGRGLSSGRVVKPIVKPIVKQVVKSNVNQSVQGGRGTIVRPTFAPTVAKPKVPTGASGRGLSTGRITKPVVKTPTGASGRGLSTGRITKPVVKTPTGASGRGASAGRITKPVVKTPTGASGRGASAGRITKPVVKTPTGASGRGASAGRILKPKVPTGASGRGLSTGRITKPLVAPKTPTGAVGRGASTGRIVKPTIKKPVATTATKSSGVIDDTLKGTNRFVGSIKTGAVAAPLIKQAISGGEGTGGGGITGSGVAVPGKPGEGVGGGKKPGPIAGGEGGSQDPQGRKESPKERSDKLSEAKRRAITPGGAKSQLGGTGREASAGDSGKLGGRNEKLKGRQANRSEERQIASLLNIQPKKKKELQTGIGFYHIGGPRGFGIR